MRAILTAVIAAIEAAAVALAGLVVVVVPAVVIWVVTFGLAAQPADVFAVALAVWFLAHGVPMEITVGAESALELGAAPEDLAFTLSLAPLGIALISVVLAVRAGWRLSSRGGVGVAGVLGGFAGFGTVALLLLPFTGSTIAWPHWGAAGAVGAVYGVAALVAFVVRAGLDGQPWWEWSVRGFRQAAGRVVPAHVAASLPSRAAETLRLASGAMLALSIIAATGFALSLVLGYIEITSLTQGLQLDPLGAIVLFLVQTAYLPVALVWTLSWFVGSGFAIGSATSVTPFETLLGPLPALPLFGALPQGWGPVAVLAPMLVVLAGVGVGVLAARRTALHRFGWAAAVLVPLCAAVLVGLAVAALCVFASGGIGPDRLAVTGAHPWITGGLAAGEIGGGLVLGVVAGRFDAARVSGLLRGREGRDDEASSATADLWPAAETVPDAAPSPDAETVPVGGLRRGVKTFSLAGLWSGLGTRVGGVADRFRKTGPGSAEPPETADRPSVADGAADAENAADAETEQVDPLPLRGDDETGPEVAETAESEDAVERADASEEAGAPETLSRAPETLPDDLAPLSEEPELSEEEAEALLRAYSWDASEGSGSGPRTNG